MSGGFQYNMTTQTEYQQMKQKNLELQEQNQALKQSLEELIKINNQLTDSMEQFNDSAMKNKSLKPQIDQKSQQLAEELQYYKNLVYTNEDKAQIINALQGLIDSFNQTQKLYEEEISNICEELDHYKTQWQSKLQNYEQTYINKLKTVDELITQLRKKQQIVSIIQKKHKSQDKHFSKIKKVDEIDHYKNGDYELQKMETNSQKKANDTNNMMKSTRINLCQKQVETLRERQKHLNAEIQTKNRTIIAYSDLITKLKKKLLEKF